MTIEEMAKMAFTLHIQSMYGPGMADDPQYSWENLPTKGREQWLTRVFKLVSPIPTPLTFEYVSRIGLQRCNHWHPAGIEEWSVADWALAMCGEAGEVANAVKKLRRLETGARQSVGPQDKEAAVAAIAQEIGDTYLYLDLLAQRLGLDIAECVRSTFNRVSIREGFEERL